jgi:methylthioribose-1-phosphate isomerase
MFPVKATTGNLLFMIYNGKKLRTIWFDTDENVVKIIDQRYLPFEMVIESITTCDEMCRAITDMYLRGAPLIGVAAAYGVWLALLECANSSNPQEAFRTSMERLSTTRPTAVNLLWAINRVMRAIDGVSDLKERTTITFKLAGEMADEDADICRSIGEHGLTIIENLYRKLGRPIQVLTHCNAGALATVDYGTATSPMYIARERNIPIHVWVDETRPRNQGRLTSWELQQADIDNTVICDNTGGYLMQQGKVDMVIVGTDRVTANGDVANKIGTYLKALAAHDNDIPFYVALPSPTIDWSLEEGVSSIPIEERSPEEVLAIDGDIDGKRSSVRLFSSGIKAKNYGFDITPARLVTGFITEKGICKPNELKTFFGR